jgi:HK97 family phage portal protein
VQLRARVKAVVGAVNSFFGATSSAGVRPVRGAWGWLSETFAGAWQAGVMQPDPLGALTAYGAVYACNARISNDIAKLQPRLMSLQPDGTWLPAPGYSPYWKVLRRPNGFQNRIQFFAYWLICKLIHGNAYSLKARDGRGMVNALYLIDPRRVKPMVAPDGSVFYQIGGDDLAGVQAGGITVPASEVIHDRINCLWHPLVGISPLYACGMAATQGVRIQRNSAAFFENMSRPSGMLTAPGTIDDPTADRLKREWESNFGGSNLGRLAVLGDGLKYEPMTIPANDAQLIEQLKWTVEDVSRAFGMPLYKIGAGTMPTNNNVESLNQQYYDDCLQPHIEALELCLDEGLEVPTGYAVELDLDGLLRMDSTAHIEMLTKAVGGAVMTPNEARARRNLPPVTGGNAVYLQQQNYSLEALSKRDARPDPFAKEAPSPAPAAAPAPEPAKSVDEGAAEFIERLKASIQERAPAVLTPIDIGELAHG